MSQDKQNPIIEGTEESPDQTPQAGNDFGGYDELITLSPREHIRLRPGMYIGKLGDGSQDDDGIYVLKWKELIDQSFLPDKMKSDYHRLLSKRMELL